MTTGNGETAFEVRTVDGAATVPPLEALADHDNTSAAIRVSIREAVRDVDRGSSSVAEVSTTVDPASSHDSVTSSQDDRDHAGDASHGSKKHDDDDEDDIVASDEVTDDTPTIEAVADHTPDAAATTPVEATDPADAG